MAFEAINVGATNLTAADIVRRNALPVFSGKPAWEAMFSALGAGDDIIATNNQLAFDQLFLSTASEEYLNRIVSDRGFVRPVQLTLSTETLRQLTIRLSAGKQTTDSLNWILDALYGYDATRTYITATVAGPYNLTGQIWELVIDGRACTLTFLPADFLNILSVPIAELANVINIKLALLGSRAFAATTLTAQGNVFRIYSGAAGLAGSVKWAQTVWPVAATPWAYNGGATYSAGDIVYSGSTLYVSLQDNNTGNAVGVAAWWKSRTLWRLLDNQGTECYLSQVASTTGAALQIVLPVTPAAVSRTKFTGAYLQVGDEVAPADLGTLDAMRATYMATAKQAVPSSAGYGPYLWDTNSVLIDYSSAATPATLTTSITKYSSYVSIVVGGTYSWMPQGEEFWVVIGPNTVNQTQPIRVINRTGSTLWLDSQYQFQQTIAGGTGVEIYLVADRTQGVPADPQNYGSCYLTGTSAASSEAVKMIKDTKAAGIPVDIVMAYPGDRGLGGEGGATSGPPKLSDKIWVWGSDTPHVDWIEALNG